MAHETVLLEGAIDALAIKPNGVYVDGTFGRGGHTRALLARLGEHAQLIAVDQDQAAIDYGHEHFSDARLTLIHGAFSSLPQLLSARNLLGKVDGVLVDLGVSSPQLDTAARGFSFMQEGPLDMRMDQTRGVSASDWVNQAEEAEIAEVLWRYGEERQSRRIAKAIVARRGENPLRTTGDLVACVTPVVKKQKNKHPATRTFQAIRIFINRELEELESLLAHIREILAIGGRLVVISFHSLEDRMVKTFLRHKPDEIPVEIPVKYVPVVDTMKEVVKRIKPASAEIRQNPRARSAVMRVAERLS